MSDNPDTKAALEREREDVDERIMIEKSKSAGEGYANGYADGYIAGYADGVDKGGTVNAAAMRELVRRIVKSLGGKAEVAPTNMTPHEVAILNQCRAALPRRCETATSARRRSSARGSSPSVTSTGIASMDAATADFGMRRGANLPGLRCHTSRTRKEARSENAD